MMKGEKVVIKKILRISRLHHIIKFYNIFPGTWNYIFLSNKK